MKIAGRGCPFPSGKVLVARRMYPRGELLGDADIFKRGRVG